MPNIAQDEPTRNLQARIPERIYRGARIEAARRDTSLQEWVAAAVKEKLDRDNPRWLRDLPDAA